MKPAFLIRNSNNMKLFIQRKLRQLAIHFEHLTSHWVVPNSTKLCLLIENTDKPNFDEYFRQIDKLKARWIIHDHYLESYSVRGRLMQFKFERGLK